MTNSRSWIRLGRWLCLAVALALAQSSCGSAKSGLRTSSHGASQLGTEPPQRQAPLSGPGYVHQVIAKIGRYTITRAYLERWTPLEMIITSRYQHSHTVPVGYVPDPPAYKGCIASLAAARSALGVNRGVLKERCHTKYEEKVRSTLTHLIQYVWIYEEARKKGVTVAPAEIQRDLDARGVRPEVLAAFGIPRDYQRFAVGAELLTGKLFATLPAYERMRKASHETMQMANEVDSEDTKYYQEFEKRWGYKTHCIPEFVVAGCSDYGDVESL